MDLCRWASWACLYLFCFSSFSVNASLNAPSPVLLRELSGKQTALSSLQGKWVIINYWASWCQPCLDEIHQLNAFYQHNQKKVALYAVNYEGLPTKKQAKLTQRYHLTYPSLREDPAKALGLSDIVGVPVTFVLNPRGKFVKTLYGPQTLDGLNRLIQ